MSYTYYLGYYQPDIIWYAHYRISDGVLLSLGTVAPDPIGSGTAVLMVASQPNLLEVEWDTSTLSFVARPPETLVDRVYEDLATDSSLTSAWAALTTGQADDMKSRFAAMLGPYRYRLVFQSPDLE